jgi:hypothetical protein
MLSKMIVKLFTRVLEVALWLSLIGFVGGGVALAGEAGESTFIGGAIGFLAWVVFAVVFMGAFLLIADIQKSVEKIASSK